MYYLNNFFFFSILGHLFETIVYSIFTPNKKSGFLYLWWTPIYGLGVIIILLIYKMVSKKFQKKLNKNIILFFVYFFVLSIVEFLGGTLLEKICGYSFWSYSNMPLHLGKYVSFFTSLAWTVFAFGYIYWIKKYTDKIVNKIPKIVTILFLFVFVIDNIISIWNILN